MYMFTAPCLTVCSLFVVDFVWLSVISLFVCLVAFVFGYWEQGTAEFAIKWWTRCGWERDEIYGCVYVCGGVAGGGGMGVGGCTAVWLYVWMLGNLCMYASAFGCMARLFVLIYAEFNGCMSACVVTFVSVWQCVSLLDCWWECVGMYYSFGSGCGVALLAETVW